jgi:hypothetical protein
MAIKKAHGVFRKLCNDTLIFKDGSIKRLVSIIIENSAKKPVLFWGNDQLGKNHRKAYIIDNFDSFVKIISFMSTWIGGFGIWEEDFDVIDDIFKGCDLHLWHTKILFEIINRKKNAYVNNEVFFYTQDVTKKNLSYGIYRIFYENYLGLYQQYLDNHSLKDSTFNYLKKHELFFFFLPWIVNISCDKDRYITEPDDNLKDMVSNTYRSEKYYILFCVKLYLSMLKRRVRNRIKAGY